MKHLEVLVETLVHYCHQDSFLLQLYVHHDLHPYRRNLLVDLTSTLSAVIVKGMNKGLQHLPVQGIAVNALLSIARFMSRGASKLKGEGDEMPRVGSASSLKALYDQSLCEKSTEKEESGKDLREHAFSSIQQHALLDVLQVQRTKIAARNVVAQFNEKPKYLTKYMLEEGISREEDVAAAKVEEQRLMEEKQRELEREMKEKESGVVQEGSHSAKKKKKEDDTVSYVPAAKVAYFLRAVKDLEPKMIGEYIGGPAKSNQVHEREAQNCAWEKGKGGTCWGSIQLVSM